MSAALSIAVSLFLCATLDRRALSLVLSRLKHILPRRVALPALECVLIEGSGNTLQLTVTDASIFVRVVVPAAVSSSGTLLAPLRRLAGLTRSGPRHLIFAGTTVSLGAATHRLAVLDPGAFPPVPTPQGEALVTLLRPTLAHLLAATTYAMSTDDTRPHLRGLQIERRGGELRFVATDGHRLAVVRAPDDGPDFTLLVGRRTIEEVERLVATPGGLVCVLRDGDRVWFVSGPEWVSGPTVEAMHPDAKFPLYEQVIPESSAGRITFPARDLVEAVRAVAPQGAGIGVTLRRDAALVSLAVDDGEGNRADAMVPASFEGELPEAFGVNAQFLRELLGALTNEDRTVTIALNGALDPMRVDGAGGMTAVVMPMRV